MVSPIIPTHPENAKKEYKISWIILYYIVAQSSTLFYLINTAIKNTNAVNVYDIDAVNQLIFYSSTTAFCEFIFLNIFISNFGSLLYV